MHRTAFMSFLLVLLSGGVAILENPPILWLDPACCSWIRHHALHSTEVAACQHGLDYRKSWLFVSNLSALESLASTCVHPPGAHVITSGRRSAQGTFLKAMAERFPPLLSSHIGEIPFLILAQLIATSPVLAYSESPRGG